MTEPTNNPWAPTVNGGDAGTPPPPPVAGYGAPGQGAPPGYPPAGYGAPGYPPPYPPGYYPGAPVARKTNGLAIASMVLGILWIWWIGSVLALIFGYIARGQIKQRGEGGDGMAIAGIVLGWVGAGFFALFLIALAVAAGSAPNY